MCRHNGPALSVIKTSIETLPGATVIAYFDTAFHRSIPLHIASYAINQDVAKKHGLKKYGFHGLSCMSTYIRDMDPS
jgi:acetate kinase